MNHYLAACGLCLDCTLCDFCGNACGHCSWSRKNVQRPVPGWDAVRRDICLIADFPDSAAESYVVIHCPEFLLENHRAREFAAVNWERVRRMALESLL